MGHLQRCSSGEHPDPDLTSIADEGNEGNHLAVGGHGGRLFHPDEIGESPELDVAFRSRGNGCGGRSLGSLKIGFLDVEGRAANVWQARYFPLSSDAIAGSRPLVFLHAAPPTVGFVPAPPR